MMIIEDQVLFVDVNLFGDNYEHEYFCRCHDGHAVCMNSTYSDAPDVINVKYPKLEELTSEQKDHIRKYRGIGRSEINYGDVMITYGEIEK